MCPNMSTKEKTAKSVKTKDSPVSRWISYRPEIKIVDCTIRDGGLMNNHHFDDQIVKAVYTACVEAGGDYMEIGYKASRKINVPGEHGAWEKFVEEDKRRIICENPNALKLSVIAETR